MCGGQAIVRSAIGGEVLSDCLQRTLEAKGIQVSPHSCKCFLAVLENWHFNAKVRHYQVYFCIYDQFNDSSILSSVIKMLACPSVVLLCWKHTHSTKNLHELFSLLSNDYSWLADQTTILIQAQGDSKGGIWGSWSTTNFRDGLCKDYVNETFDLKVTKLTCSLRYLVCIEKLRSPQIWTHSINSNN